MKKFNLVGQTFGRLTVISEAPSDKHGHSQWRCLCKCGTEVTVRGYSLTQGKTVSCGCFNAENAGKLNRSHGRSRSRLYSTWNGIKFRCHNPSCPDYAHYGARGIEICDEWNNSFESFHDWAISHGYKPGLTIDRINFDGNYSPENCRWVEAKKQNQNKRNNVTYKGKCLAEWARILGINRWTLYSRVNKCGWPVEKAISELDPQK